MIKIKKTNIFRLDPEKKIILLEHDAYPVKFLQDVGDGYRVSVGSKIEKWSKSDLKSSLAKYIYVYPFHFLKVNYNGDLDDILNIVEKARSHDNEKFTVVIPEGLSQALRDASLNDEIINKVITEKMESKGSPAYLKDILEKFWYELVDTTDAKSYLLLGDDQWTQVFNLHFLDRLAKGNNYYNVYGQPNREEVLLNKLAFVITRGYNIDRTLEELASIIELDITEYGLGIMLVLNSCLSTFNNNTYFNTLYDQSRINHIVWRANNFTDQLAKHIRRLSKLNVTTYGENMLPLGENSLASQAMGPYLSEYKNPIVGLRPLESGVISPVNGVTPLEERDPGILKSHALDINKNALRTIQYKKISNRIDDLIEMSDCVENDDAKEKAINLAKSILEEIYNTRKANEMKREAFNELDALTSKVEGIVADIQIKKYDIVGEGYLKNALWNRKQPAHGPKFEKALEGISMDVYNLVRNVKYLKGGEYYPDFFYNYGKKGGYTKGLLPSGRTAPFIEDLKNMDKSKIDKVIKFALPYLKGKKDDFADEWMDKIINPMMEYARTEIKKEDEYRHIEKVINCISLDVQNLYMAKYPSAGKIEGLYRSGEAGIIRSIGKGLMRIPTAVADKIKSLFTAQNTYKKAVNEGKIGPIKEFFQRAQVALDTITPPSLMIPPHIPVVGGLGITTHMKYDHIAKRELRRHDRKEKYEELREERGYRESIDLYTQFENMELYEAGEAVDELLDTAGRFARGAKDVAVATGQVAKKGADVAVKGAKAAAKGTVAGTKFVAKKADDLWKIQAIKKIFKEVKTAILTTQKNEVLYNNTNVQRIINDHIDYWERYNDTLKDNPEYEGISKAIDKELASFRKMLKKHRIASEGK